MRLKYYLAAACIVAAALSGAARAGAPDRSDFVSRALALGFECDAQWKNVTARASEGALERPCGRESNFQAGPSPLTRTRLGARAKIDFCSPSGLIPRMVSGVENLPRSTQPRGSATRGLPFLASPAESRLNQLSAEIRSFKSSLNWTKSFQTTRCPVRPALKSFRRLSQSDRSRSPARPASRASRPIKF